jgi:hypothetical protein
MEAQDKQENGLPAPQAGSLTPEVMTVLLGIDTPRKHPKAPHRTDPLLCDAAVRYVLLPVMWL